eukprot:GHVU01177664.1.p2 GENE.GHVU01177664.1~~GHVU01177664.1.p2  ORF type:complete len:101 (+),score=3.71 GHVU01177664.1:907-1209(+)
MHEMLCGFRWLSNLSVLSMSPRHGGCRSLESRSAIDYRVHPSKNLNTCFEESGRSSSESLLFRRKQSTTANGVSFQSVTWNVGEADFSPRDGMVAQTDKS